MKTLRPLDGRKERAYTGMNTCRYITVHETGNAAAGADARAHANLLAALNPRSASWHWSVDDTTAIQSYAHTVQCWHTGTYEGNATSIGVEVCVNAGSDFRRACDNAARVVAEIMDTHHIPLANVVQHNHWSGKNCPQRLRSASGGDPGWSWFLGRVRHHLAARRGTTKKEEYGMRTIDLRRAHVLPVIGDNVKKLQGLLLAHGYGPRGLVDATGRPDGIAGRTTRRVYKRWQKAHPSTGTNGKPDLIVGPVAWRTLIEG